MRRSLALLFCWSVAGCAQPESGSADRAPAAGGSSTAVAAAGVPSCQPGAYEGIGAAVEPTASGFAFTSLTRGAPAEAAGVRVGDNLVSVDGVSTLSRPFTDVHHQLLGRAGTEVLVGVERLGVLHTIAIQRALLKPTC